MPELITEPVRRPRRKHVGRHIPLPSGDELWPRREIAEEKLGINEKTLKRYKPPTVYISNSAYCPINETMQLIADRIRRPSKKGRR